jgi:hypothetical protein
MSETKILTNIRVQDIRKLKKDNELVVEMPYIKGITLTIQREQKEMSVLGVPTMFYGEQFVVKDNADTIHCEHDVLLEADKMVEYVESLKRATNLKEFHYYRKLKEKGLTYASKIEFGDGKQAVIAPLSEDCPDVMRALFYIPLKKDGKPSKIKPRILYGNAVFKVIE